MSFQAKLKSFGKCVSTTVTVSQYFKDFSDEMSGYICGIFLLYNEICQHFEDGGVKSHMNKGYNQTVREIDRLYCLTTTKCSLVTVSDSTLQVTFKKVPLTELWCNFKE